MPRRLILSAAALALALAGLDGRTAADAQVQPAGEWPQWRGPNRDGISNETGLLTAWPAAGPPSAWTATGLGAGFSGVAVSSGRVFTMGDYRDGQYVLAIEAATSRRVWATRVGPTHVDPLGGPRSTPTIDGDRLYVVTTSGDLVCLETAAGRERWRRSLPRDFGGRMMSSWMYSESPLVDGDRVVATPGGRAASIVALDKTTGAEIWRAGAIGGRAGADGAAYSSIVISHGGGVKQYVQLMGRGLAGVRASDGAVLWSYNRVANDIANISTPVVTGDLVFASTAYSTGSALLELRPARDGGVDAIERYFLDPDVLQSHHGGFVLLQGYLYGGHGHGMGFPFCLELETGRMAWARTRGPGLGSAAVTAADGHLYFRYEDGLVALVEANPARFVVKGTFQIPNVRDPSWPHPVVAGGRLYLREQDRLYVYDVKR
jgi:outer membrane protein assembly factor BamB